MNSEPPSQNLINNPERSPQNHSPYKSIQIQGNFYRVLTKEIMFYSTLIELWAVIWTFVSFVLGLLIASSIYSLGPILMLGLFVMGSVVQSIYCCIKRRNLHKIVLPISFLLILYTIVLVTLVACKVNYTFVPTSVLSLAFLIYSFWHAKNKGKVVLLLIVSAQIVLITAKIDGFIEIGWVIILIPLLLVALLSLLASLFLVFYTAILKWSYSETYLTKKYSLIFLVTSLLGIDCLNLVILGWVYLDLSLVLTSSLSLCGVSMIALYLWLYNQEIALYFCQHKQRITEGDKELKVELILKETKEGSAFLYRYSSTWFGKQQKKPQQDLDLTLTPECIICTHDHSEVVWLPCGHLSLCSPCSEDLLASKMLSCVLCKQKPQQICKIQQISKQQRDLQREMGLIQEEDYKNRYVISQLYEIKVGV